MKTIITGGGKAVYFLCRAFLSKGWEVAVVNPDQEECEQMARKLRALVIKGDGSDPAILEDAGARGADAVVAATPDDATNLAVCQLAKIEFDVPRALAMVGDPDNEEIFRMLGITVFCATSVMASMIEQRAALEEITNLMPLAEGKVNITEMALSPDSPAVGRTLRDLALPPNSLIAVVMRDGKAIVPRGDTCLQASDRVILITLPDNHGPVIKIMTGESR
ncbi:MAG TPA: TrkA family potassium uptake protein [Candidatus Brocadiia bacterium]|nr:TrkA family potassium uptake protein [Candidatus Brocadiia bacterium]